MLSTPWWKDYDFWTAVGTVGAVVLAVLGTLIRQFWEWYRRPILRLSYANRDPWRRLARAEDDSVWLFFRISVENTGHRVASGVKGFAFDFRDSDGNPQQNFEPIALHWVGTEVTSVPVMNLLPGQREFLDVIKVMHVNHEGFVLKSSETLFLILPQVEIARGLQLYDHLKGQSLRVRVSGENAPLIGMLLTLPPSSSGSAAEIELKAKIVDRTDKAVRLLQAWHEHKKALETGGPMT